MVDNDRVSIDKTMTIILKEKEIKELFKKVISILKYSLKSQEDLLLF